MRRFSKDTWVLLGVMAGLVLVAWAFVYRAQGHTIDDLHAKVASKKTLIRANAERAAVLPQVAQRVEDMKSLYQELDRRIPQRTELGGFLREISGELTAARLSNQLIEPGNPTREELFHTLPIIMRFEGNYLALADLLQRIHTMQRLARVQKLRVERKKDSSNLQIELQMNIYFTDTDT